MTSSTDKKKSTMETTNFLSGRLAQVDVQRIERELKELWHAVNATKEPSKDSAEPVRVTANQSGETPDAEVKPSNVMRACTANIVLFSEDADAEVQASAILDEVTVRHPSRAILAISRRAAVQRIEAWVSARCHIADSKTLKQICSEQITVRYEGEGTRELASVVSPLVINDLPVVLWWRANRLDKGHLEPFHRFVDMLIVDSLRAFDSLSFIKEMSGLCASANRKPLFDLNWGRLIPWRRAIADAFNDAAPPMSIPSLPCVTKVTIKYARNDSEKNNKNIPTQPLMLLSWLATRLKWEKSKNSFEDGTFKVEFKAASRTIVCDVVPFDVEKLSNGSVCSVIIDAETPDGDRVISERMIAEQRPGSPCIYVLNDSESSKGNSDCDATTGAESLVELTEARLIDFAMESKPDDEVFRETLAYTIKLIQPTK